MPKTERGKAFEKLEPTLTHAEALAAFSAGAAAISLAGRPCLGDNGRIKYIAVKLALSDGRLPVVLFDRMSASALKQLIDVCDKVNWDGKTLNPGPTTH